MKVYMPIQFEGETEGSDHNLTIQEYNQARRLYTYYQKNKCKHNWNDLHALTLTEENQSGDNDISDSDISDDDDNRETHSSSLHASSAMKSSPLSILKTSLSSTNQSSSFSHIQSGQRSTSLQSGQRSTFAQSVQNASTKSHSTSNPPSFCGMKELRSHMMHQHPTKYNTSPGRPPLTTTVTSRGRNTTAVILQKR